MLRNLVLATALASLAAAGLIAFGHTLRASSTPAAPAPWPMFHHDAQHTGVQFDGAGNIISTTGPIVRWKFKVTEPAPVATQTDSYAGVYYRWTSSFPLADLDGDGTLEVIVTTPDGTSDPDRVIALKDTPTDTERVRPLWIYTAPVTYAYTDTRKGFDTYSPVVGRVGNRTLVVFSTKDGFIRALDGATGQLVWQFDLQRRTEDGPMLADLYGDGSQQIIITTDCRSLASTACPNPSEQAMLYALPLTTTSIVTPLWSMPYPYKIDSSEPAIAALDPDHPNPKQIILGTWGGELLVAWPGDVGAVVTASLNLHSLDASVPLTYTPVIRTSPLVWDWGEGATAVFGWLPTDEQAGYARLSAVGIRADVVGGVVTFTQRWMRADFDVWKSSPTLLPISGSLPLIVAGYGLALPPASQSGTVGACYYESVFGGAVAFDYQGHVRWNHDFRAEGRVAGNVRASAAVAQLDGDGRMKVILPVGCYGALYAYDQDGAPEWNLQLGPRSQGSPSIGDLGGDGKLDVVLSSYDGYVWALSGGARSYLPAITK